MDYIALLTSVFYKKMNKMNREALSKGLPLVIKEKTLNNDYRLVVKPRFGIPPVAFKVIYKVDSPEEVKLGTF